MLSDKIQNYVIALDGYRVDRTRRGGGVAIFVLHSMSLSKELEFLVLDVSLGPNNDNVVLIGAYRPPPFANLNALDKLVTLLSGYETSEGLRNHSIETEFNSTHLFTHLARH